MADADQESGSQVVRNFGSGVPAIALYLALVGILLWLSLARTGGMFVYAQDDPYIHLALARTLADHGVWGIRPTEFASASSSPLWTVLLAALWKLGAHAVWVPFVLNILFGVAFLAVSASYVARAFRPANSEVDSGVGRPKGLRYIPWIPVALVLVTPLPTLAFIGMEHTLQVLLVVVFAWQASERLAGERHDWAWPCVTASLMVADPLRVAVSGRRRRRDPALAGQAASRARSGPRRRRSRCRLRSLLGRARRARASQLGADEVRARTLQHVWRRRFGCRL